MTELIPFIALFLVAFLYSSVGHAGASGYLAVFSLLSFNSYQMRPAVLILNIVVALIASFKYIRNGYFSLRVLSIFAIPSVPFAYWGATLQLPGTTFKMLVGLILLAAAFLMLFRRYFEPNYEVTPLNFPIGFGAGASIGFLSGLISVGGGIFLSPILIFFKWASVRNTSGISALFILVNSLAGLMGQWRLGTHVSKSIVFWIIAVILGGSWGSHIGSQKLNNKAIVNVLLIVLFVASLKMLLI